MHLNLVVSRRSRPIIYYSYFGSSLRSLSKGDRCLNNTKEQKKTEWTTAIRAI